MTSSLWIGAPSKFQPFNVDTFSFLLLSSYFAKKKRVVELFQG